jgi:hypothetical protein
VESVADENQRCMCRCWATARTASGPQTSPPSVLPKSKSELQEGMMVE